MINPRGDQRERMEARAGKLRGTGEPGRCRVEPLAQFERDVGPWLGAPR